MGSSNIQLWNPTFTNTDSDSEYTADPQRTGGAPNGSVFPSKTGNKVLCQTTAIDYSIGQFLAGKGFNIVDSDPIGIIAALNSLFAGVPGRSSLQVVSYSPSLSLDASKYIGFQISLSGNVNISISGQSVGDRIAFILIQDSVGGRTVTWPLNFKGFVQPSPLANDASIQIGEVLSDYTFRNISPNISSTGMNNIPIGASSPSTGNFSTLKVASAAPNGQVLTGNGTSYVPQSLPVVPSYTSGSSSLGYWEKNPNGKLTQWGNAQANGNSISVTFPMDFTDSSSIIVSLTSVDFGTYPIRDSVYLQSQTIGYFTAGTAGSTINVNWIAVGY